MKKKSYKITFALKEGYAPKGKVYPMKTAAKIIQKWMLSKLKADEPIVSGLLQQGQLFFPAPGDKAKVIISPTAVYYGELSSPEDLKRADKEIRSTLESLAKELKEALKQDSVFITYQDVHWCV